MKTFNALAALLAASTLQKQGVNASNFRFRKFNVTNTARRSTVTGITFPLSLREADILREPGATRSISVVRDEEVCAPPPYRVDLDLCIDDLKKKGLYPVTHPEDEAFWEQFEVVVEAQRYIKMKQEDPCIPDPLPKVMPYLTQYWKGFDILEVAEAVHDEFPGKWHYAMLEEWVGKGEVVYDDKVVPKFGNYDFLRRQVMLSDMVGYAFRSSGPCNFSLKWREGRARPEEVAFAIFEKTLNTPRGIDLSAIAQAIRNMDLKDPTDFTAYAEGSPTHPSWPAMHSASSASSFWLDVILILTPEQRCTARMLDWSVSYARTVAGVHYPDDNLAGLTVGQGILAQILPDYLERNYNADKHIVKKKIEKAMFDWNEFVDSDCYKEQRFKAVPAAEPEQCLLPPTGSKGGKSSKSDKSSKLDKSGVTAEL